MIMTMILDNTYNDNDDDNNNITNNNDNNDDINMNTDINEHLSPLNPPPEGDTLRTPAIPFKIQKGPKLFTPHLWLINLMR